MSVDGEMDIKEVKSFWQNRARAEVDDGEVTHKDIWQRWLEIETIKKFVAGNEELIDIGCGNGFTTRRIGSLVSKALGVDYSEEMINRAAKSLEKQAPEKGILSFSVCDVMNLGPKDFGTFDMAISERCLINLAGWEKQKNAIANIASVVRPGGLFLFIEGSVQGRDGLNKLRESVGLEAMPKVWHNIDFDEKELLPFMEKFFTLEKRVHFGVYDYLSRVVHPLAVHPKSPEYDSEINKAAAYLALISQEQGERKNEFSDISRVLFLVLRRKPE